MTSLHLHFAGNIKRADFKTIGGKAAVEIALCRKNYTKQGDEPTFTWVSALVWEPKDWQASKLVKGAFVSGHGELTLRSYDGKDGQKQTRADVRCSSFDIEVASDDPGSAQHAAPAPVAAPRVPVPTPGDDDSSPPF